MTLKRQTDADGGKEQRHEHDKGPRHEADFFDILAIVSSAFRDCSNCSNHNGNAASNRPST
ncbi:MAG: hypothetical protein Pars92KO_05720 [Parasphingorhabdus sp.]